LDLITTVNPAGAVYKQSQIKNQKKEMNLSNERNKPDWSDKMIRCQTRKQILGAGLPEISI
jgi:uncharacterized Zn-finger protein